MLKLPRLRARVNKRGEIRYYFDLGGSPRRWEPLGKDVRAVRRRYDALMVEQSAGSGTLDKMLGDVLEKLRGTLKPSTLTNYRAYRKHLAGVFDPRPETITQADVLRYLRICPRTTFRNEVGLLSMAFANWMDEGRLTFNPCFGVRIKRKGSKRTRLLQPAEIDAIVGAGDERLAVAVELAYATGLRIGDVCALRWADLAGVFELQKTGVKQVFESGDTLTPILERARALQARVASLHVLCDRRGRRWNTQALRKHWDAACKRAGVADAHFHDLRAAGATAIEKLYGAEAARQFLGHKDIRTTMIYLRDIRPNVVRPLARKA